MKILNLTQHCATPEQAAAGVVDLPANAKAIVSALLTFDKIPTAVEILERANEIAATAEDYDYKAVMIGGAPWFMSAVENALALREIAAYYAFSVRESVEKVIGGKVVKTNVFRHAGFVPSIF